MINATSRRVVRNLAHRNLNWSAPVFRGDQELINKVNSFRAWCASADALAEKYSAPPTSIDFAGSKGKIRDVKLVDALESMYKSASVPAEVHVWDEADQASAAEQIEEAKVRMAETQDLIAETEAQIAQLKACRTTRETSLGELKEVYPEVAAEVETEINNREWFKDTLSK